MRVHKSSVYAALIANGMFLSVAGGIGIVLAVGLHQPEWACAWLIAGIFGSELLLYRMLRSHCRAAADLEHLTASLTNMLERQAITLGHEEEEIIALCTTMVQKEQTRKVWYELTQRATSNLSSLVGGLEQAEASLPEMLCQTRAWVARTRDLAVQIQTQVENLADEVSGS
jgi:hypothetical protein